MSVLPMLYFITTYFTNILNNVANDAKYHYNTTVSYVCIHVFIIKTFDKIKKNVKNTNKKRKNVYISTTDTECVSNSECTWYSD